MQLCTKCKLYKDESEFYKISMRGIERRNYCAYICKICDSKKRKEYYLLNRDKILKKEREKYKDPIQKEKKKEWGLKFRKENKEYEIKRHKDYHEANKNRVNEKHRLYSKNNRDKLNSIHRKNRYNLNNWYIKLIIKQQIKATGSFYIPEKLIEAKRQLILLKRQTKNEKRS